MAKLSPITVSVSIARRFARAAVGLDERFSDILGALNHLGYVQIDPINVCGRMHDLILRNRVKDYRQDGLMEFLHGGDVRHEIGDRMAFEHHFPDTGILVAFSLDAWPHLLSGMRKRALRESAWSGKLTTQETELAPELLSEIKLRGPLSSRHFGDAKSDQASVWGSATLAKSTLQKLFFHGQLLIAGRENNRRLYDLPEKILPEQILNLPEPEQDETNRWLALTKLRQRRLVGLKRGELALVEGLVQPIHIEHGDVPLLYLLREDLPLLERFLSEDAPSANLDPLLLAPLDPLIYDRKVTSRLWDFDYIWEVYTPPEKRVRGYYALPILAGDEIVGYVDPKADVKAGKLNVISKSVRRGYRTAPAVKTLARFLGLK
ncbi:YcaQ family DNA glycosylase [Luteolibacter pohnpeiensis]|uniref:YcaQ family DNA glycosylase n=1 Tax=Luteolibacter pohnpeiensis TaxID=454153 RepID=A0A934S8H1_9BACT|nr:crosslink repair DNA glycosylase YcaQ family protein [Luteolibacter pohnpeiensis]MBK1883275.1 YcaQ family DNA glycosylase [Luteolibacter pohnpeiensis]